ncbi:MAG: hypothetical protein PUD68_12465 [Clostridiales bacterium]|nr:hypothetical protein [Clostridiales bacterium]
MSRYTPLWRWIAQNGQLPRLMTFAQIENILGFPIDHAFLTFKKELTEYGYRVVKISMKAQTVLFERLS